jgi:superoxide dismutase
LARACACAVALAAGRATAAAAAAPTSPPSPKKQDCRPPGGELLKGIEARWGGLDKFIAEFNAKTAAVQGSGWGWLGYNKATRGLEIATCANQDPLAKTVRPPARGGGRRERERGMSSRGRGARSRRCSQGADVQPPAEAPPGCSRPRPPVGAARSALQGLVPLLGVDVWEVSPDRGGLCAPRNWPPKPATCALQPAATWPPIPTPPPPTPRPPPARLLPGLQERAP